MTAKKQKASLLSIIQNLQATKELIITLKSAEVKEFKNKLSQLKHWIGIKDRLNYKLIKEEGEFSTLHLILGDGEELEVEHYGIEEVEKL